MLQKQQDMVMEEKFNNSYYTERDYHWLRKTRFAGGGDNIQRWYHYMIVLISYSSPGIPKQTGLQKGYRVRPTFVLI